MNRWLGRLAPSSRRTNRVVFGNFMGWLKENGGELSGLNPDELVDFQMNAVTSGDKYKILDVVQDFVNSYNLRYNSLVKYYTVVRSFFAHNRVELPRDRTFTIQSDIPKVRGSLEPEMIRDMVISSKPVYQAIILSMFQGGMGQEEYVFWNLNGWESLKKQLDENVHPIKIDLPGRKKQKNKRPYYTFIGKDAIEAIRNYVDHYRPEIKEDDPHQAIFLDQYGNPLSKDSLKFYWKRHTYKTGIVKPVKNGGGGTRHGKGLHELRDNFRTQWERSSSKAIGAKYFMGHQIDALEYNQIFRDESWARKQYEDAEKYLNIMSSGKPFGQVDEDEVSKLNSQIQGLEAEVVRYKAEIGRLREEYGAFDERLERMREYADERLDRNSRLETKVVYGEEAMVEMVNRGWELMKEINGNRYIMRGEAVKTEA